MAALAKTATSDMADKLIAQAVASIEAADHFSFPFPHILFRNFFPPDFYWDLVRSIPSEGYDPITGTGTRMALRLYGDNVEKIDPEVRSAWAAVSAMLTSKKVERAIRIRLNDGLDIRARGDKVPSADDPKLVTKPVIYRDIDGYQIKPHPDTRKGLRNLQSKPCCWAVNIGDWRCRLLRRMSPLVALFGHGRSGRRCPLSGVQRKSSLDSLPSRLRCR
jgi:hypothetical protein